MGATKKYFYTEEHLEISDIFKAFGHPARTKIVEILLQHESLSCNEMQLYIPLSQSTISKHMNSLYEASIIGYEILGKECFFKVNSTVVNDLSKYIRSLFDQSNPAHFKMVNTYFKPRIRL